MTVLNEQLQAGLLDWFDHNRREMPWRQTRDPYRIWLSEVMLQQTQVQTVIPYYQRFLALCPDLNTLVKMPEDQVLKLWEGLGYYRRVLLFQKACRMLRDQGWDTVPPDPDLFAGLPGVGSYTCGAVMSIAFKLPLPAVDGNVVRVLGRALMREEARNDPRLREDLRRMLATHLPKDRPGDYNQSLMELGALVCTPRKPQCAICPWREGCRAREQGVVEHYPRPAPPRRVPQVEASVAMIFSEEGSFWIQQRPLQGHLGGLWELPGGKLEAGETPAVALLRECQEELGWAPANPQYLGVVRHRYTHFALILHAFVAQKPPLEDGFESRGRPGIWLQPRDIPRQAFPGATHRVFRLWGEWQTRSNPVQEEVFCPC